MVSMVLRGVLMSWEVDAIIISESFEMDLLYSLDIISEISLRMMNRQDY